MDRGFELFPEAASAAAPEVDRLYFFLLAVSAFFTILIFVLIVSFALRFRRRRVPVDRHVEEVRPTGGRYWILEATWTLIPLALTMVMFAWGADLYYRNMNAPRTASRSTCSASSGCGRCITPTAGGKSIRCTCRPAARSSCE